MLYFLILGSLIALFILILFWFKIKKNSGNNNKKITIDFDTVESLNVSKIVTVENDIDFIRNDFWYQYKQKQIVNSICFYNLKKIFENEHHFDFQNITEIQLNQNLDTFELIQIIISDENEVSKVAEAFYLLEKRIN